MAELATIARPYAEALFQSSLADLSATSVWITELANVASDKELQALAANPNFSSAQVFDLIVTVAPGVAQSEPAKNFLQVVLHNRRMSALPEIAAQFHALKNKQAGYFDAVIYSAFPIEDSALQELGPLLETKFKRKLHLSVHIDEELIGGVRVVVGDEVLDTSVKARLEQMKAALLV